MSKKVLEIYTVLGEPPNSVLVAKIWIEKQGDLYVTTHAPHLLAGKYSYHESGITHRYTELVRSRSGEGEHPGQKLRGMRGFQMVTAWGCPVALEPTGYQPKRDTKVRRTLVAPRAKIGWFWHLWAIERGRRDLAERIGKTDPWPSVPVVATLLADWSDPWLLVTVSHWGNDHPYDVVRYEPAILGRVPYEIIPNAFEGTWLEQPGPKWRPGDPFPEEWLRDAHEYVSRQRALAARRARRGSSSP
jgi:hypothetical protein